MRDELWKLASAKLGDGNAVQIWSDRGPQGFRYRSQGPNDRELVDLEGVALVRRRRKQLVAVTPQAPAKVAPPEPPTVDDGEDDLLW